MGGTIIAQGYKGGAGIGGMYADHSNKGMNLVVGNINISGGVVITRGGDWSGPVSIGGGGRGNSTVPAPIFNRQAGRNISISDGIVIAEGGNGYDGAVAGYGGAGIGGVGGTLTINGGTVYARGGIDSYGIGPGKGNANEGDETTLSIIGGKVILLASSIKAASSVYASDGDPANGILVGANEVDFGAGLVTFGTFPGYTAALTAKSNFAIPAQATLTIPPYMTFTMNSGKAITNNGIVRNDGIVNLNSGGGRRLRRMDGNPLPVSQPQVGRFPGGSGWGGI